MKSAYLNTPSSARLRRDAGVSDPAVSMRRALDPVREPEVAGDAGDDQRQMRRIPPAIEEQRRDDEPAHRPPRALAESEKPEHRDRQEVDQVLIAVEKHGSADSGAHERLHELALEQQERHQQRPGRQQRRRA